MNEKEKIAEEKQEELETLANENCLVRVVAGSHAYGTNIVGSDWDERAIFADNMERIVLPFEKLEQVQFRQDDKVYYELSKYMPLLLSQNPNVIELLWTDEKDILFKNESGQSLINNRAAFLSIKVKDSYVGYAMAQLKRIKGHNKWINSPQPEREPQQKDFASVVWNYSGEKELNKHVPFDGYIAVSLGSNNYSLWNASRLNIPHYGGWMDNRGTPRVMEKPEFDKLNQQGLAPDMIAKINFELFDSHHTNWKMYWNWKNNRNEKRGALEEKFGYDVKHAMHLIRLLRSGIDILEKGIVPVKREDAAYLLEIRSGHYTYGEIVKESERLSARVEALSKTSHLPQEPDYKLAKAVMLDIYANQWNMSVQNVKKMTMK